MAVADAPVGVRPSPVESLRLQVIPVEVGGLSDRPRVPTAPVALLVAGDEEDRYPVGPECEEDPDRADSELLQVRGRPTVGEVDLTRVAARGADFVDN